MDSQYWAEEKEIQKPDMWLLKQCVKQFSELLPVLNSCCRFTKQFHWSTSFTQLAILWHFPALLMRQAWWQRPVLRPAIWQGLALRATYWALLTHVKYFAAVLLHKTKSLLIPRCRLPAKLKKKKIFWNVIGVNKRQSSLCSSFHVNFPFKVICRMFEVFTTDSLI